MAGQASHLKPRASSFKATAFDELFESSYNVDHDLDGIPAYLDDNDYNDLDGSIGKVNRLLPQNRRTKIPTITILL